VVSDALTVDQAMARSLHRIDVRLPPEIQSVTEVQHELQFLRKHQSNDGSALHVFATVDGAEVEIRSGFKYRPSLDLHQQMTDVFGSESVKFYVEGLEPTEPARYSARS
ncbi:MAG: hypothetical protein AAFR78_05945, partial [Planctomycetota bacterium]